jgi:C4-type Zn-finger protein
MAIMMRINIKSPFCVSPSVKMEGSIVEVPYYQNVIGIRAKIKAMRMM